VDIKVDKEVFVTYFMLLTEFALLGYMTSHLDLKKRQSSTSVATLGLMRLY